MFDTFISTSAQKWSVNPDYIRAIIQVESNWNPNAYNPNDPTGAWGLGQILYRTAQGLGYAGPPDGLFDPATNIDLIAHLVHDLVNAYGDDFRRVYSAYNSGDPDLWETSAQVAANVQRAMEALQTFLGEHPVVSAGLLAIGVLLAVWLHKRGV